MHVAMISFFASLMHAGSFQTIAALAIHTMDVLVVL